MDKYTKYPYPENESEDTPFFLSLSNQWSRKTINSVFSGEAKLADILKDKSVFSLPDENDLVITEKDLPDCIERFDLFLEEWISKKIILHIDFLLSLRLMKKES